ncbi:hypothetical protein FDECE_16346 [Fusarium decemcellulare]|nr:hypothetical protein FDECE_16346 [Fusarium decemcellulare]
MQTAFDELVKLVGGARLHREVTDTGSPETWEETYAADKEKPIAEMDDVEWLRRRRGIDETQLETWNHVAALVRRDGAKRKAVDVLEQLMRQVGGPKLVAHVEDNADTIDNKINEICPENPKRRCEMNSKELSAWQLMAAAVHIDAPSTSDLL